MQKEIIVISDIHFAKIWDKIGNSLPKNYPYLNPNALLREIVNKIKKGQTLVINGDLVDYFFADYTSNKQINWNYFFATLSPCKGKVFLNTGNHDYREIPYNFSIYGLKHVNITDEARKKYLVKLGFDQFRYLKELPSIFVNKKNKKRLKDQGLEEAYSIQFPGKDLLFLSTGPDYFHRLSRIFTKTFLSTFRYLGRPCSEGLTKKQIIYLERFLAKSKSKEIIIFIHTPPFFSVEKERIYSLPRSKKEDLKGDKEGNFFIENRNEFINVLAKSNNNIIVITSHTHIPCQNILDKKNKIIRSSSIKEINKLRKSSEFVKFVGTLPIGAIEPKNKKMGYLVINDKIKYKIMKEFGRN
ncbi:MAG: metallophosphoesterase [Nanoarchaeota archaeon]|nr:metallophosphoesterase [Nanoarchaeota archaeon]